MIVSLLSLALVTTVAGDAGLATLRSADARLAAIGWRLATRNAALCDVLAPTPGWAIHALGQYDPATRGEARAVFGFPAAVGVEAVVPDGAAAMAGVAQDDGLLQVNGEAVSEAASPAASSVERDATLALIARQPADAPLRVVLKRGGRQVPVIVAAAPGCRSSFEVLLGTKMEASSDGSVVQVGARFFDRYDDAAVAVVVAHELAHNILRHAARLDTAGVKRGLLAEVGRNGRLFRRTEDEADLLGVHLLRNAGYDPQGAVRFWRDHGGEVDGGLFRSRTHRSSKARAERIAAEIAAIPADTAKPYRPPILATRDETLE